MKTSCTAFLATLLMVSTDLVAANCMSACQSQLVHFREDACQKWRERLPRPDLFNHCGQGFNKGKTAGCEGFCTETPDMGAMKSLRLDACSSLKGYPPYERQQACQAGFSAALDLAKDAAVITPDDQQPTPASSGQGSQAAGQDAGTARKLEATGDPKDKQKVKVKNVIEPGRRNLLDDARREAEAAFNTEDANKIEL